MPLKWSSMLCLRFMGSWSNMQTPPLALTHTYNWTGFSTLMTPSACTDALINNHICKDTPEHQRSHEPAVGTREGGLSPPLPGA